VKATPRQLSKVEKAKSEKVKKLVDVIQSNFFTFSLFHFFT